MVDGDLPSLAVDEAVGAEHLLESLLSLWVDFDWSKLAESPAYCASLFLGFNRTGLDLDLAADILR